MFLAFADYVQTKKRKFKRYKYETDIQYRAVLFRQFARAYRNYCDQHQLCDEYEKMAYDIRAYEKRLQRYRDS